jgi:hypothetical protein
MRTFIAAAVACAFATVAIAQQGALQPKHVMLDWVADEANELVLPADGARRVPVYFLPSTFYSVTAFRCGDAVTYTTPRVMPRQPVIELVASKAGTCQVNVETSRRRYLLDITVEDPNPQQPTAPVASVRWKG